MPAPSHMDGIRNFRFTSGTDILELEDTDFWVSYEAQTEGTGEAQLSLVLNGIWEHTDLDEADALTKRKLAEARLKELTWDFVGKKGELKIDADLPEEEAITDITLLNVSINEGSLNELIEYSLRFSFPLTSTTGIGGVEVARSLKFAPFPYNLALRSEEFELSGVWVRTGTIQVTANTTVPPPGVTPATLGSSQADSVADNNGSVVSDITQDIAVPDDSRTYEFSIFVKKDTTPSIYPGIEVEFTDGTPIATAWTLNVDTGGATLSSGITTGHLRTEDYGTFWRYVFRLANNGTGNTTLKLKILPAVNMDGSSGWVGTTQGTSVFFGAQAGLQDPNSKRPIPYLGTLASSIFAELNIEAENYVIDRTQEDRTEFKPVFRAPFVRIPNGQGLETILVRGIKELITGADDLEKRQDLEAKIKLWLDEQGNEGLLFIDSGDVNEKIERVHLQIVTGSELGLPDAVVYDATFIGKYAI